MNLSTLAWTVALIAGTLQFRADLRRRNLPAARIFAAGFLSLMDFASPALLLGSAMGLLVAAVHGNVIPLASPLLWSSIVCLAILVFAWGEGRRQVQFQRPNGIIFAETLILTGAWLVVQSLVFGPSPQMPRGAPTVIFAAGAVIAGGVLIGFIVPPFVRRYEGHRILDHLRQQDESVQTEYASPTHECPHPERWRMLDSQTSELEVLEFLKSVVMTVKPELILETGTFTGYSAIKMAEGLKANGFGRIITIEYDKEIFAKAKERIEGSGLASWIEYRNASSLETRIDGAIDIFFSDSKLSIREDEIRRFLPQINPQGLILIHDASSHFRVVREAVLRLEAEGLISAVLLSTPRGMVVAQKRDGRK